MIVLYYCAIPQPGVEHQCARALLFRAAGQRWPELGPQPVVERAANGKPFFRDFPHHHFNLSHSGGWAVCALSDAPVGIDLQTVRSRNSPVARKFTAEEQAWLSSRAPEELYALWAKKEAYLKYTGAGLTQRLSSFSVLPLEKNEPEVGVWDYTIPFPHPLFACAVCGKEELEETWHPLRGELLL